MSNLIFHNIRKSFNLDDINREAKHNLANLILLSEKQYTDQIKDITNELGQKDNKRKIVLLAGPSASGKTTTSNLIRLLLAQKGITSTVVSLDDFFINRENVPLLENGKPDFENITTLDLKYLNKFVDDLLINKTAKMPKYNFVTGRREEKYTDLTIDDNTIVIFEGIHALNPMLIKNHQDDLFKIYICVNANFTQKNQVVLTAKELRMMRRMLRDYLTRGYTAEATIEIWDNVLAGEDKYIKPFKNEASYIIDSTHMYEPLLYATYLMPLLNACNNDEIKNIKKVLQSTRNISKDFIPESSLIREFLGEI